MSRASIFADLKKIRKIRQISNPRNLQQSDQPRIPRNLQIISQWLDLITSEIIQIFRDRECLLAQIMKPATF